MFCNIVFKFSQAEFENRIILVDDDFLYSNYVKKFEEQGFIVVMFNNDLEFRIKYEKDWKENKEKILIITKSSDYIPYDIQIAAKKFDVKFENLFQKLNSDIAKTNCPQELELISYAYNRFDDLHDAEKTELFLSEKVHSKENVEKYVKVLCENIKNNISKSDRINYKKWLKIAEKKAEIDVLSAQYDLEIDTNDVNEKFKEFALGDYATVSNATSLDTPVIVSKILDFIHGQSSKFILIVMDGMSEFDWNIISKSFCGIKYKKTSCFSMIPSTTSVSRQCVLSNKNPAKLENPWSQAKEMNEFKSEAAGYSAIYSKDGYDSDFSTSLDYGAVVILDIDELVHAQKQGRKGMYQDVKLLAEKHRLADLTKRLVSKDFDVYITADHGNTICKGIGKYVGAGIQVETKSHRMIVLKDLGGNEKQDLIDKFGLIEFKSRAYLPKNYDYLICDTGKSLDNPGEIVMTHGGITIDEVVVPFITVKAEENK